MQRMRHISKPALAQNLADESDKQFRGPLHTLAISILEDLRCILKGFCPVV